MKWPRRWEKLDIERCAKGTVFIENREIRAGELSFIVYPTKSNATRIGMLLFSIPGLKILDIDRAYPESVPHMDAPVTLTLRFPLHQASNLIQAISPLEFLYPNDLSDVNNSKQNMDEAAKQALADCITKYPPEENCQYLCIHGHVELSCTNLGKLDKLCIVCESHVVAVSCLTPAPSISKFFYKQRRTYELLDLIPEHTDEE